MSASVEGSESLPSMTAASSSSKAGRTTLCVNVCARLSLHHHLHMFKHV